MGTKIYCIKIHGVSHEMELINSDCKGYYAYKLIPMELGYEPKIVYIAPDRADYWLYDKPMQGGKQISHREISHFYIYK
jgi:hypothetical protein